jgi:nucleoside-diphosphate-sugar epimerase
LTNRSFWHKRSVFLTGHTGFKGPWLALWLTELGAKVTGFAVPPERASSRNHRVSLSITHISDGALALSESFEFLFATPIRGGVTDERGTWAPCYG